MGSELDKNYGLILQSLKEKIRQARVRASWTNNLHMLQIYWDIGNTIFTQEQSHGWGAKIVERLAKDLRLEFIDMKGISPRNLRYMRDFANAYPHFPFLQAALAKSDVITDHPILQGGLAKLQALENQSGGGHVSLARLTWYHHITLLDKVKDSETRKFYIHKTIENGWTRDVLVHQIQTGLHLRQGALTHNFKQTLPDYESELAQQLFKDPYQFDFLMLGTAAKERDLENAIINQVLYQNNKCVSW
jgi:predicted nuclease of restriction endonuclease-like (RecB) superfamily